MFQSFCTCLNCVVDVHMRDVSQESIIDNVFTTFITSSHRICTCFQANNYLMYTIQILDLYIYIFISISGDGHAQIEFTPLSMSSSILSCISQAKISNIHQEKIKLHFWSNIWIQFWIKIWIKSQIKNQLIFESESDSQTCLKNQAQKDGFWHQVVFNPK